MARKRSRRLFPLDEVVSVGTFSGRLGVRCKNRFSANIATPYVDIAHP